MPVSLHANYLSSAALLAAATAACMSLSVPFAAEMGSQVHMRQRATTLLLFPSAHAALLGKYCTAELSLLLLLLLLRVVHICCTPQAATKTLAAMALAAPVA